MKVQKFNTSPYSCNSYLVNQKILIDTGMEPEKLIEQLKEHIDLQDLELIVLTHCHFDHTASALEVASKSGASIGIHEKDAKLLNDDSYTASTFFGQSAPPIVPDILYQNGDIVVIDEAEALEIIHTPGHTPGGICLYEPYSKGLFSGDTVFSNGGIGRSDFKGGDAALLHNSIEKLTKLDIITLYPGHGPVTSTKVNLQLQMSLRMSGTL